MVVLVVLSCRLTNIVRICGALQSGARAIWRRVPVGRAAGLGPGKASKSQKLFEKTNQKEETTDENGFAQLPKRGLSTTASPLTNCGMPGVMRVC